MSTQAVWNLVQTLLNLAFIWQIWDLNKQLLQNATPSPQKKER